MPLTVEPVCRLDLKAQDEERGNNPYHTLVFQGGYPFLFFLFPTTLRWDNFKISIESFQDVGSDQS